MTWTLELCCQMKTTNQTLELCKVAGRIIQTGLWNLGKKGGQEQQRFQEETPDEGSNCQWERMEEESNPNETSDKTNKSASKSSSTKSNKQKQQKFQEETPDEGSNHQQERTEEESNPNKISDKTNKSTSKSSFTKLNKQKQQRFQEETPSEGSKRQQGRMEEESDLNETSDKTNKSTSKSTPIKSTLKSAKSTKLTQEESDDEVIEIEPPNIPIKVVKDDQGNEKVIDDDDTDLEAENLKLKKRIDEVQAFADKNDDLHESLNRQKVRAIQEKIGGRKVEMKSILKIIDETRGLDYNKTFNSVKNLKIRHKLVSELRSALAPCFPALNKQLTKWLGCLHKSSYSHQRLMDREKANENKHQVAKRLYSFDDERITKYDKHRLLKMLSNRLFHSPEISETDEEDLTKSIIAIYDYSWRSDELKNLLRNVFDVHSLNKAKLIREHRYDDEGFNTEYDEVEEVSRGTTPATGNTTENDEDHNKEGKEKPSNQRILTQPQPSSTTIAPAPTLLHSSSLLSPSAPPFTPISSTQDEINDFKNSRVVIKIPAWNLEMETNSGLELGNGDRFQPRTWKWRPIDLDTSKQILFSGGVSLLIGNSFASHVQDFKSHSSCLLSIDLYFKGNVKLRIFVVYIPPPAKKVLRSDTINLLIQQLILTKQAGFYHAVCGNFNMHLDKYYPIYFNQLQLTSKHIHRLFYHLLSHRYEDYTPINLSNSLGTFQRND
ncbi:hypothetical protein GLOIN_2v1786555 [Rhizophagus irregularis DAOM 181602=DAOM 197198]|uniref:Uncharacterized protein n=1 Tax=Rhizophagus irregularis (strain DAOM 181602 / DAOM 197198 / MUCL 43194) TaxID=747089 RepID=A0A2P4P7X1_RHIID|nr:hypothetical protein GLOIN_2v1786555 [Rhizophagus irregularis DAOM 181602=DAOM 197198]POG61482.1 hypothetical protein GLOIN_2v1786555 [Rhizophagus irregularis DAOM 181602=DAOM 197198]|eukprot:XP_025168348.1 hypothetical protein GLOIN_2v1786555 [Rhizophagus irregularis DAOM 181602=DAOM 197198]